MPRLYARILSVILAEIESRGTMHLMIESALAAFLAFSPAPSFAADPIFPATPGGTTAPATAAPTVPQTEQTLAREIGDIRAEVGRTADCLELESGFKADLAKKKAGLSAEFKGKIPVSFNDLLWQKSLRINKQHALCFRQYDALGKQFEAMSSAFRDFDLKKPALKKQKELFDEQKAKYMLMLPTDKPHAKASTPNKRTN